MRSLRSLMNDVYIKNLYFAAKYQLLVISSHSIVLHSHTSFSVSLHTASGKALYDVPHTAKPSWFFTQSQIFFYELWPCQLAVWVYKRATTKVFHMNAIDGERFAGLNIRSFSAIKVFTEILSRCSGHKCSLFSTIKGRCLYSRKKICGTPENREKQKFSPVNLFPLQ